MTLSIASQVVKVLSYRRQIYCFFIPNGLEYLRTKEVLRRCVEEDKATLTPCNSQPVMVWESKDKSL